MSGNAAVLTAGQGLPLVAGAVAIPFIYRNLGAEAFGAFTIALSLLGMFAFLDLGIGRSAVRFMARAFAAGDEAAAANVLVHSGAWIGGFSLLLAAVLLPLAGFVGDHWPARAASGRLLAAVLYVAVIPWPLLAISPVLRAVLEAREQFRRIAVIQVVTGSLMFLLPLLVSFMTRRIEPIVAAAVASRLLGTAALLHYARKGWTGGFPWRSISRHAPDDFRRFSVWIVISNVIGGAVIHYGDRALLLRLFPFARVAFYNVPLEFLGRFQILVNNAVTAAFPGMSRYAGDAALFERTYLVVITAAGALVGPMLLGLSLFTPTGLDLWLGAEFRDQSTAIVRLLLAGLMCWTLNSGAVSVLNARGFARAIALMHVFEVPLYFAAIYLGATSFGLAGVAAVWSARHLVEYVAYTAFSAAIGTARQARARTISAALVTFNILPVIVVAVSEHALLAVTACATAAGVSFLWIASMLRRDHAATQAR